MRILSKHKATLLRLGSAGLYDESGEWQAGTPVSSEIPCIIQPDFAGTKQRDLPEGIREEDCRIVYTKTPLQGASEELGNAADILQFDGLQFEVHEIKRWFGAGRIKAWEVLCIRKDKL